MIFTAATHYNVWSFAFSVILVFVAYGLMRSGDIAEVVLRAYLTTQPLIADMQRTPGDPSMNIVHYRFFWRALYSACHCATIYAFFLTNFSFDLYLRWSHLANCSFIYPLLCCNFFKIIFRNIFARMSFLESSPYHNFSEKNYCKIWIYFWSLLYQLG